MQRVKLKPSEHSYCYYEWHHIVPMYAGGTDELTNLVLLTAREHFIAHRLYAKAHNTSKAWACVAAFLLLSTKQQAFSRELTSIQVEQARAANAKASSIRMAGNTLSKGRKLTAEHKVKLSQALKGRTSNRKGSTMPASAKAAISASLQGNQHTLGYKQSRATILRRQIARHYTKPETKLRCLQELELILAEQEHANSPEQQPSVLSPKPF